MDTRASVESVLRTEFGGSLGQRTVDPSEDLLASGIIDSFGLVGLISALESRFGISIGETDVVPENFQTLDLMTAFVDTKLAALDPASAPDAAAGH